MEYALTFLEGLITFVSPCILPMLPIYLVYFAGGEERSLKRLIFNVLAFIAGFSLIFVAMGALAGSLGHLLHKYQTWVNLVTGAVVIFFGLRYLGLFGGAGLGKGLDAGDKVQHLNPGRSFLFGLVFALAWTPCLGTFLGSALMLAGQAGTTGKGMTLLLLYSLGLGIPFFLSALLLNRLQGAFRWIREHFETIQKVCGVLLVVLGILMATGTLYKWTLEADPPSLELGTEVGEEAASGAADSSATGSEVASSVSGSEAESGAGTGKQAGVKSDGKTEGKSSSDKPQVTEIEKEAQRIALGSTGPGTEFPDFAFTDAAGKKVHLSDYSDKPIVLNFWASWCPPCRAEMPYFQYAYGRYGGKVHFVMLNATDGQRETKDKALAFLDKEGYSFPPAFDEDMAGLEAFNVYAFPTTVFLWKGKIVRTYTGALRKADLLEGVEELIELSGQ